jgi:hypothetical protein
MVPRTRAPLAALPLLAALALPASAAVPSPANSALPTCFAACPMGDLHIVVTIRDFANNPIAGSSVVLDLSLCPEAYVCTSPPADPYIYDAPSRTIRMFTGVGGVVDFPLRVGGVCGAGSVRMYADGVFMASYALASPDQTGNGMVVCHAIDTDCDVFMSKFGTINDPTADFDCDGDVDVVDQVRFDQHGSHACAGFVDAAARNTWGRVKAIYR